MRIERGEATSPETAGTIRPQPARRRPVPVRAGVWLTLALAICAAPLAGQSRPGLRIDRGTGSTTPVSVQIDRGYATVPFSVLADLGWSLTGQNGAMTLTAAGEITVFFRIDSPFFRWDGVVLQLTDPPYVAGGIAYVPLQFLSDFLPRRLPGLYEFSGEEGILRAGDLSLLRDASRSAGIAPIRASPVPAQGAPPTGAATARQSAARSNTTPVEAPPQRAAPANSAEAVASAGPSAYDGTRVVVIDAGHGGADPGALGPDGIREKTVALEVALRLERMLRARGDLEIHMIRKDDSFVDVWERGQIATDAKGERPGVYVSIHANSFPARRAARGFETYFLSDARTEHERRVSAIENAPLSMRSDNANEEQLQDLDFILRDLRNYEYAHWSESLASLVQDELNDFHPGPNRGVKQGVLAVLTNALMPSVLVEVGYLSNEEEARLLGREDFHENTADAIATAVVRFFERYPPGSGTGSGREDG